jgi:uncharacterized membrane protein
MEKRKINSHPLLKNNRTFGQRASDNVTKWAGSWGFILSFVSFLVIWMGLNGYFLVEYAQGRIFDPYPFILLNLVISVLTAVQAPMILMSQNRAGEIDRIRAEYAYKVDIKAEKEIEYMQKQLDRIEKMLLKKR